MRREVHSQVVDPKSMPWIPVGPGEHVKPLHILKDGGARILLLRLNPGTLVPRHRHLGEVHTFHLSGHRKLLETGEVIRPGDYVFEPAGNVDSWVALEGEPVVVSIVAYGAMEYLDENDRVVRRDTSESLLETYLRYCAQHGLIPSDLSARPEETRDSVAESPDVSSGTAASAPPGVRTAARTWCDIE